MGSQGFHLDDKQRDKLLTCWMRPRDRKIAAAYLQDVELIVTEWMQRRKQHPPTDIKAQIAAADDLRGKAETMLVSLEHLPQDVAKLLNTVWLWQKYGDEYFKLHEEAYRKDIESCAPRKMALAAFVRGFAPEGSLPPQPEVSELSKLPSDYFKQANVAADFLRGVADASREIVWMLKNAKQWHNKGAEEGLLYSLAIRYEHHFGKLPSAANARKEQPESAAPFRQFAAELSNIIGHKLGADIIRKVVGALKKLCLNSP